MTIHLDTSFLILALVRGTPEDAHLRRWLRAGEPLAVSAVAWTEFLCGPVADQALDLAHTIVPERVPFGDADADVAARLFNEAGRRRGTLIDCMIAATAMRAKAALATANPADFRRFSGIHLAVERTSRS